MAPRLPSRDDDFATTRWSVVLAAGGASAQAARTALETLCQTYWFPLYAYVRRQGHDPASAEDLTQEFFARLLAYRGLRDVHPERGRFRAFLRASIRHLLINESDRARAAKRGGGRRLLSLDFEEGERRYRLEPSSDVSPELLFDKHWALTLLDRVREGLRGEYEAAGNEGLFDRLQRHLAGEAGCTPYAEVACEMGMTEGAVKVAAHRLRQRFRQRLRREIAETVARPEDVDEEVRDLFNTLRS